MSRWTHGRVARRCRRLGLDPDQAPSPSELEQDEAEAQRHAAARRPAVRRVGGWAVADTSLFRTGERR